MKVMYTSRTYLCNEWSNQIKGIQNTLYENKLQKILLGRYLNHIRTYFQNVLAII